MPARNRHRMILCAGAALLAGAIAAVVFARHRAASDAAPPLPRPLLIEARGMEREWQFTYAGADAVLGSADDMVTRGHLRVPAGAEVILELRSDDYLYVFSCPDLDLKEIAVPDLDYRLRFRAAGKGDHELAMDPLCGFRLPAGQNMGSLRVTSETEFRSWFAELAEFR